MNHIDALYDDEYEVSTSPKKGRPKAGPLKRAETVFSGIEDASGKDVGLIVSVRANSYLVLFMGEEYSCERTEFPNLSVGDRVILDAGRKIEAVLARQGYIARLRGDRQRRSTEGYLQHVIAANVDVAVIVAPASNPGFHPRFVDRYLIVCQNGGVQPVIALSKSDLTDERHPMLAHYRGLGIPVVEISSLTGAGIDELKDLLRGRTSVVTGASGVGKSSLINRLIPEANLKTHEVTAKEGKGKHTTTASSWYQWADDSYIIDTPGIRSLGLDDLDKKSLASFFPEIEELAPQCKFSDCLHLHEPGCAVKEAAEGSKGVAERYESYVRLMEE